MTTSHPRTVHPASPPHHRRGTSKRDIYLYLRLSSYGVLLAVSFFGIVRQDGARVLSWISGAAVVGGLLTAWVGLRLARHWENERKAGVVVDLSHDRANLDRYVGSWIALDDQRRVVMSAKSLEDLRREARDKGLTVETTMIKVVAPTVPDSDESA